jgi:hypothetical protein
MGKKCFVWSALLYLDRTQYYVFSLSAFDGELERIKKIKEACGPLIGSYPAAIFREVKVLGNQRTDK